MNEIRALFPGAAEQVYLDVAVRGLLSLPVRKAIDAHLEARTMGTGDKDKLRQQAERTREAFAALVHGDVADVALTKNVSEGLNLFAASIPWQAGDNVVLCPELEHPNNVFLWYNLQLLYGVEVRTVEPEDGRVPTEKMAAVVDAQTRLVTLPHISFAPGFVADIEPLSGAARQHGALVLLDAAQSVGAIDIDVATLGVDAMAVATQKCLLALYGFGFLWVRRDVADTLHPRHVARYGVDLGDAHETALGRLQFQPGARRFDLGNFNYLGAAAAQPALDMLRSLGMDNVEHHLRSVAARLAAGLSELGLPVVGGAADKHRAHIVSVGESGGGRHYSADDPAMNELHAHLCANGVRLSIRSGVLRMSVGIYNNESDVDRVVAIAREWLEQRGGL